MQTSVDEDLDRLIAKRADRRPDPDEQEQAERSGDKLLACAACHRGIDLGVQGVVDSYLAARPSESRASWEAYTAAHREVSQSRDVGSLLERALTERALSSVEQSSAFGA